MSYYSAIQPSSLKEFYTQNDIVDFIIKLRPGRAIVPGSLRMAGDLNVITDRVNSPALVLEDKVHLDTFAGIHSVVRSVNTQVNNISIENTQAYPRIVSMMTQANQDLDSLNTSSSNLCELKGTTNCFQLIGNKLVNGTHCVSFSMKPQISLNMANGMLGADKFGNVQLSFVLANAVEAFYTGHKSNDAYMTTEATKFSNIHYKLFNLLLQWDEVDMAGSSGAVVMPVKHLYSQTITSESSFLNVQAPALYNAISLSFIQQSKRNSIFHNNLQCEKIFGMDQVGAGLELLINGVDTIIPFSIQDYNLVALNYLQSLNGSPNKNLITNKMLEHQCFGIGFQMLTSSNDRLAIQLKINSTDYNNQIPKHDAFIFINSFIQM